MIIATTTTKIERKCVNIRSFSVRKRKNLEKKKGKIARKIQKKNMFAIAI